MQLPKLSENFKTRAVSAAQACGRVLLVAGKVLGSMLLVLTFAGIICAGALGLYVRQYLLPEANIDVGSISMNYTSVIYSTDSVTGERKELTRLHGSENRVWVNFDEIPRDLRDAFIAIEDERFESHKGVDWKRTVGAVINLVLPFSSNFGGSTITQQLIKNLTGDNEVTVQRKMLEILRALNLERQLSKEQIMEMYLNTINLSQGCYGVSAASYVYFGKPVSELSLRQCACLAGITNSPTYYDPFQNPDNNLRRSELILGKMLELGKITESEYDSAMAEEIVFGGNLEETQTADVQSYFVDMLISEVISALQEEYGYSKTIAYKMLYAGGLEIDATIDPAVQEAMESIYTERANFPSVSGTTQLESAMVVMSTDGRLLGIVGGIGEKYGNLVLNRALSKRSPGSAIKPISVYAPAIEYNLITPYSVVDDSPSKLVSNSGAIIEPESAVLSGIPVTPWPANQNRKYSGLMTVSTAVAKSVNTVSVRVLDMMTLETAFDFATENFGLSLERDGTINGRSYTDLGYSALALGGLSRGISLLELTAAYVPFANDGIYREPTCFTRVTDSDGNVLLDRSEGESIAISSETAYYMRAMLEEVVQNGTGTGAKLEGFSVAGKTGTTSNDYDRLFVGFSPYYVAGVWFGFDQSKEISGLSSNPAVGTWKSVMELLHADKAAAVFDKPAGLQTYTYCLDSGGIPTDACREDQRGSRVATAEFFPEDAPTMRCDVHTFVNVCTESGRIANAWCPAESVARLSYLNFYRYYGVSGVTVTDEKYAVHFLDGISDRVLHLYFPAMAPDGEALEGSCLRHFAPVTTTVTTTTTEPETVTLPPETEAPTETTPASGTTASETQSSATAETAAPPEPPETDQQLIPAA